MLATRISNPWVPVGIFIHSIFADTYSLLWRNHAPEMYKQVRKLLKLTTKQRRSDMLEINTTAQMKGAIKAIKPTEGERNE